jgi:hypothetical protein
MAVACNNNEFNGKLRAETSYILQLRIKRNEKHKQGVTYVYPEHTNQPHFGTYLLSKPPNLYSTRYQHMAGLGIRLMMLATVESVIRLLGVNE